MLLAQSKRYETGIVCSEIDVEFLDHERRRMNTFGKAGRPFYTVEFDLHQEDLSLTRLIDPMPFVPSDAARREARCEEILDIQAHALATRLTHIHCGRAAVAVSGGLDSTLALLVTARAFDLCGLDHKGITAITMPCFGTTARTRSNAQIISERLGTEFMEIPIGAAVNQHFKDIGVSPEARDVTYENCQARERTQVLMDLANQNGGLVIGTGDLSELALGWATYNGDHMSMYGVNASVPKTLIRHIVAYEAASCSDQNLRRTLEDILETPVSPELLPAADGEISQRTEDLVGPYSLHDFFLYYAVRWAFPPSKIYRLACYAFEGSYAPDEIKKWLINFYRRFFAQQFKRSCLPDGPKVGSVTLSPRSDWRMPSDACADIWLAQAQSL